MTYTEDLRTFGGRLRAARKAKKLSQTQLARIVGITQSMVSDLERDEYGGTAYAIQLARATGVHPLWLQEKRGPRLLSEPAVADNIVPLPQSLPFDPQTVERLNSLPPRWQGRAEQAVLGVIHDFDRSRRKSNAS